MSYDILEPRKVLTTFLVNFENGGSAVAPADAADFALADPGVETDAVVNGIDESASDLPGTNGALVNVALQTGGYFTTNKGTFVDQPILDSYFFTNSETTFRSITVSSLEEFSDGQELVVTLHGVGDASDQDTEFQITYDGTNLGLQETDYDSGDLADTFVTYRFTKTAGVDSFEIEYRNAGNGGKSGAIGGFSVAQGREAVRINAGGNSHTDSEGNLFLADQYFNGGRTFATGNDIFIVGTGNNTGNDEDVDDILYQTERFDDNLVYAVPVVNGIYNVRLHFAEIFFSQENQRVFDVSIEGEDVLDDFDIFAARINAFTPGNFASLVLDFPEIEITDGFADLQFESQGSDGINNAKISAIEIIPVDEASLALLPTNGGTVVTEGGADDTVDLVLTRQPANDVVVTITPGNEVSVNQTVFTFTPANFDVPQTVTIAAIQDAEEEGTQNVPVDFTTSSQDPTYDNISRVLNVTVFDDDVVPVDFASRTIASFSFPTAGAFGPDGRLYVANQFSEIRAYTFDNDNNVIDTEEIDTLSDLSDPGNVLGIAFNPFEEVAPGETPTLYVSRSFLFRATTDYESQVVALSGPGHSIITDVVTGLPVSGFDHGINGLQFDGEGNLLIAVGGNTNTGVFDGVFGSDAPESPLTSAIVRARISDPNFNGDVQYEFIDPNDPDLLTLANNLGTTPDPSNQLFGEFVQVVDVPGEVEVDTFAVGLRNSYDLVYTTTGLLYATDNGPNGIAEDELNLVSEGDFLGHPSIPRGRLDPRQTLANAEYDPAAPGTADYTAPLTALQSSTNGIDEYRSQIFNGQLRGQLIAQRFNNQVFFFELDNDGTTVANINTVSNGSVADGLDILTGPGGVIFGIDRSQSRITIAEPVVNNATTAAYDLFPFRAPAIGGNQFVIGGANFGTTGDTTVLIDGVQAQLISVEENRIVGVFPSVTASDELTDVTVISNGATSVIEDAFLPLGESDGPATIEGRFVFYNNSSFDGNDAGANAGDDNAIATNKTALLPGETATFANYTSSSQGINGIVIDAYLARPDAVSAADFSFAVGAGNTPGDFTPANLTPQISVRAGEGVDGTDRVTLTFADNLITNTWLQVTVEASAATGRGQADVFYFGNVIGDVGNSPVDTIVDSTDASIINLNRTTTADVENRFDINRDGVVDSADIQLVRRNRTGFIPGTISFNDPTGTLSNGNIFANLSRESVPLITAPLLQEFTGGGSGSDPGLPELAFEFGGSLDLSFAYFTSVAGNHAESESSVKDVTGDKFFERFGPSQDLSIAGSSDADDAQDGNIRIDAGHFEVRGSSQVAENAEPKSGISIDRFFASMKS